MSLSFTVALPGENGLEKSVEPFQQFFEGRCLICLRTYYFHQSALRTERERRLSVKLPLNLSFSTDFRNGIESLH